MAERAAVRPRDAVVPAVLAGIAAVELVALDVDGLAPAIAVVVASCLLLIGRRRHPWAIPTASAVGVMLLPHLGPELDEPAVPILVAGLCSYTLGRRLHDLRGLASMGLVFLVVVYALKTEDRLRVSDLVFVSVMLFPPYVAGLGARSLAERNARLVEQADELRRLQAAVRSEAAAAERGRIARELHDVIAHSVSAMVVQAAAASELVRSDPDRAVVAADEAAATGRRALAETGRLLHLIRDTDNELGLAPTHGLGDLPDLVDGFRRNGLQVELAVDGSLEELPAGVDLSGYRIVQEALTNAFKHAPSQPVRVHVRREPRALVVRADNPAGAVGSPAAGAGLGLVGMAERVSVFGGTLTHGMGDDGRWVLAASLPLPTGDA